MTAADVNQGKYGNLGLILTKFDHQRIVCAGLARPNFKDCEALLDQMPATDIWEEFGSRDKPNVEVPMPWVISGGIVSRYQRLSSN